MRAGLAAGIIAAAAIAAAIVPLPAIEVERIYSTGLYPAIQRVLTPATNLVPFALLDALVIAVLVPTGIVFVRRLRAAGFRAAIVRLAALLAGVAAIVYLWFLLLWGLNYRRVPLEARLDYDGARVTQASAKAFADVAAAAVNGNYGEAHAGVAHSGALERAFDDAQRTLGAKRTAVPGIPKRSLLGIYFRRAAIAGMTDPLFLEVILNPDLLEFERPVVIAHEWAHLAGYAHESDANFVAWLTCVRGDAQARYSGWLAAYQYAVGALPRAERQSVRPLDPGPRGDLRAMYARYARSSPAVRTAAQSVYDQYLKANRVPEGIGSYDEVLRLMVGTTFGEGWTPALR